MVAEAPPLRTRNQRGSTLLLFPAGVLVLLTLGAIALDFGNVYSARRALIREVGAAADDGAQMLDVGRIRGDGAVAIDQSAAQAEILEQLSTDTLPGRAVGSPTIEFTPDRQHVTVTVTRDIPHILGRAVPGVPDAERITVRLTGSLEVPDAP